MDTNQTLRSDCPQQPRQRMANNFCRAKSFSNSLGESRADLTEIRRCYKWLITCLIMHEHCSHPTRSEEKVRERVVEILVLFRPASLHFHLEPCGRRPQRKLTLKLSLINYVNCRRNNLSPGQKWKFMQEEEVRGSRVGLMVWQVS